MNRPAITDAHAVGARIKSNGYPKLDGVPSSQLIAHVNENNAMQNNKENIETIRASPLAGRHKAFWMQVHARNNGRFDGGML